jgi:hypothetical protein
VWKFTNIYINGATTQIMIQNYFLHFRRPPVQSLSPNFFCHKLILSVSELHVYDLEKSVVFSVWVLSFIFIYHIFFSLQYWSLNSALCLLGKWSTFWATLPAFSLPIFSSFRAQRKCPFLRETFWLPWLCTLLSFFGAGVAHHFY